MGDEELKDASLLLLANKQDLKVMDAKEVADKMGFDVIKCQKKKYLGVVGITGEGLKEALDWLAANI